MAIAILDAATTLCGQISVQELANCLKVPDFDMTWSILIAAYCHVMRGLCVTSGEDVRRNHPRGSTASRRLVGATPKGSRLRGLIIPVPGLMG